MVYDLKQINRVAAQFDQECRQRRFELTNSPRASELLQHWEEASLSFRRIIPKDRVAAIEAMNEFSDFEAT